MATLRNVFALALGVVTMIGCAVDTDVTDEDDVDVDESALSAAVRTETHFTDGLKEPRDEAILNHLIRLIKDTDKGESIDIALHSITANPVAKAIVEAHQKGVKIRIAHNGEDFDSADATPKMLAKELGAAHRWCGNVAKGGKIGGCISHRESSLMHAKLVLFSKTKDDTGAVRSNVVWFGSANMTWATGAKTYNNTTTVYGDDKLYTRFRNQYFARLWAQDPLPSDDFSFASAASGITAFPSPDANSDIVLARLRRIDPDDRCEIDIAEAMIHDSRMAVVNEVVRLKNGKCKVRVTASNIEAKPKAAFAAAGIPVHINETHDKIFLVNAKLGDKRQKVVFTGSHNWTSSANSVNDELLVKIANPKVYDAYLAHVDQEFKAGK